MSRGTCRQCRGPVEWARTDRGKNMALDPAVDPNGNMASSLDERSTLVVRAITDKFPLRGWEKQRMPHAATCPNRPVTPPKDAAPGVPSLAARRDRNRRRGYHDRYRT